MRKSIFTLALLFFAGCKKPQQKPIDLLDCVPQNTFAAFQLNDQNMLVNSIENNALLADILKVNSDLYQKTYQIIPKQFPPKSLLCFTPEAKSDVAVSFIYFQNPKDSIQEKSAQQISYNQVPIQIEELNSIKTYRASFNGIHFISTSQLVLENGIRNIQNKRAGVQEGIYYDLAKVSDDNAPVNLLINKKFSKVLNGLFPDTPLFPFLGSSWFSFDFNTKKDPFTLDGVSFINDSLPDAVSLLKGVGSKSLLSPEQTPQVFDGFLALAIEDYKALEDNFKKYSRHKNIPLTQINFDPISGVDEMAWIHHQENKALLMHINHSENIHPMLFSQKEKVATYRTVDLYSQQLASDLQAFVSAYGESIAPNFVSKMGDFLIYTENQDFLKLLIGASQDGTTLAKDLNFKALVEDLADSSTFLWLGRTENLKSNWHSLLKDQSAGWKKINLKKYPLFALQGVVESNFIQTRLTAQIEDTEIPKNSVINQYSFSLEAPAIRAPQWIKNHRNKTMDIVIQDQNNTLYLFSNTGTLFWKKQLSSPIVGKIEQVDLYKNRRLQMAFRTQDRLLILDRNGKVVRPFNYKISSESPQHFSVFDYDLNRNYRFLISSGKNVVLYDNRGKKINGFRLKTLKQPLQNPAKHIRFGTKDYIVIQDLDGHIRILNRLGSDRIQLKSPVKSSSNPVFAYRNTFATTSPKGDLVQIDTKGNIVQTPLDLLPEHRIDMTSKSLVTLSENKLTIKGIPIELPFGNYTAPQIYYINNTIYVTLTDLDTQKVFAFYSNGTPVGGFPVYGNSSIDLSNADADKALEMVVQSEANGFIIYQIN
ncbi:MAG: hypothetical protein VW080_05830 [Flavobacteriaceae bacterium]